MTECFNNFKYQVRVGDLASTGTGITRSTNPLCGRISKKKFFLNVYKLFPKIYFTRPPRAGFKTAEDGRVKIGVGE